MTEEKKIAATEALETPEASETSETPVRASDHPMTGLALLALPAWEPARLRERLLADWQIDAGEAPASPCEPWLFHAAGSLVVVGLEPRPMPAAQADAQAANSPEWPDAAEAAHAHQAYVAVAVIAETASLVENARTAMKVLASLAEQPGVRAIAAASRLIEPGAYREAALPMAGNDRAFPVFNMVCFGLWRTGENAPLRGYTAGLDRFGIPEVEAVSSGEGPREMRALLVSAAMLQITRGRAFAEGERVTLFDKAWTARRGASDAFDGVVTTHLSPEASPEAQAA